MKNQWNPDTIETSLINEGKAEFLYNAGVEYFSDIIDVYDDLKKAAISLITIIISALSAVGGYALLKCDFHTHSCGSITSIFWPVLFLTADYFVLAIFVLFKCVAHRSIHVRGNEPRNLLRIKVCSNELKDIKMHFLYELQKRIDYNSSINTNLAQLLNIAYFFAAFTPIAALTLGYIIAG